MHLEPCFLLKFFLPMNTRRPYCYRWRLIRRLSPAIGSWNCPNTLQSSYPIAGKAFCKCAMPSLIPTGISSRRTNTAFMELGLISSILQ